MVRRTVSVANAGVDARGHTSVAVAEVPSSRCESSGPLWRNRSVRPRSRNRPMDGRHATWTLRFPPGPKWGIDGPAKWSVLTAFGTAPGFGAVTASQATGTMPFGLSRPHTARFLGVPALHPAFPGGDMLGPDGAPRARIRALPCWRSRVSWGPADALWRPPTLPSL